MLIEAVICFNAARDGRTTGLQITAHLETDDPLEPQAKAEVDEWVARQARIHHRCYEVKKVSMVNFQDRHGYWYSQIYWPNTMMALHG